MRRILNEQELGVFKGILGCTQPTLKKATQDFLIEYYGQENVIIEKEYVVAKGTIPVALVAHLDTVHKTPAKQVYYDKEENVMWSPQGLGADDRAGVYSIMEILMRDYKPTVIFTTDEEKGGLGAAALISDFYKAPCDLNFIIELDRQGGNDAVYYDCDNPEFERYITRFGYLTDWGSFSDISYICPSWGMAGVNLSVGYYSEHSYAEHLRVGEMLLTIDRVCTILDSVTEYDVFEYIPCKKKPMSFSNVVDFGVESNLRAANEDEEICWHCMEMYDISMITKTDNDEVYCIDCYDKIVDYCELCNEEFINYMKNEVHQCHRCRNHI